MPTMPERMTAVETELKSVKEDVTVIKGDVKRLVSWVSEERGARAQRSDSNRKAMAIMTGAASLFAAIIGFLVDLITPINIGGK